jgi:anti-anti-sigma regulatory factor
MNFFESDETIAMLNTIGENIFIADLDFTIVWINDYANELIERLRPFLHIQSKEDLIGVNMRRFHPQNGKKQEHVLENGPFPYETNINLFNKYSARIVVNPFVVNEKKKGYVLTWKDVTNYEQQIQELHTPIIETTADDVMLIPLVGTLTQERIRTMKDKILEESVEKQAKYIIIDFTGITKLQDLYSLDELRHLTQALRLVGAHVLYTGFSVELAQKLVKQNISIDAKTFGNLKQAFYYIWDKKGYKLIKKPD